MKKQIITFVFLLLISTYAINVFAQNNALVLNGAYLVENGGTSTTNIHLVVNDADTAGIIRLSGGGHIISEGQYNYVKWITSSNTGNYVFPFGVGGNPADYIPFTFNKTAGDSSVSISTWGTNPQNSPKPGVSNVGAVTNMTGITDSVLYAIDRFWDIQAPATTADLTFSYRGLENTTSSPTSLVKAQHWNGTNWDTPVGSANNGVTTGIGSAGPFVGQNTFSPWVLIIPCIADTITQYSSICQGDSITVGTNVYYNTGTYIDTLQNIMGCDSIITTNLTVNQSATYTDVETACGSFTWIDGITYTSSTNTPTDTIFGGATNGCDSIITLNLTINQPATGVDVETTCGEAFTWIDGITYTSSTNTPTDTIFGGAANGCDSIVTLNLTINQPATGTDVETACGSFTWIDGITYTSSTNTPTDTIFGGAANGCDSIVTLNLTINQSSTTTNTYNECEGFSVSVGNNTYTTTGLYTDIIGCDTIITNLTINPAPTLTLITVNDSCNEQTGSISVSVDSVYKPVSYLWNNGSTDSVLSNLSAGIYSITITDSVGCSTNEDIQIYNIDFDCQYFVYVANTFTPNGDGKNDVIPVHGKGVTSIKFTIYNRWGNKVFETNQLEDGWDGTYKGTPQNTGVFAYILEASFENGKTVTEHGDITLIK